MYTFSRTFQCQIPSGSGSGIISYYVSYTVAKTKLNIFIPNFPEMRMLFRHLTEFSTGFSLLAQIFFSILLMMYSVLRMINDISQPEIVTC